jgi:hypothetical protein
MGTKQAMFNRQKLAAGLRQAKARIQIHRGKKVNHIAIKKKEILQHLDSGNETMALIHVL